MDYCQTDSENRKKLLVEVKNVVDALGGKTDATLFVLNRIDRRNQTDDPLADRLGSLTKEIQKHLDLPLEPILTPVSALPLYYGQCAWGTTFPPEDTPTTLPEERLVYFRRFRKDCSGLIEMYGETDDRIAVWFHERRKTELLTDEDLRQWVEWCWKWSQGQDLEFWKVLRARIAERFPEIVIAPVLIQPLAGLGSLLEELGRYLEVQRMASHDEVVARKQQLEAQFEELRRFLDQEHQEFHEALGQAMNNLAAATGSGNNEAIAAAIREIFRRDAGVPEAPGEEALRRTVQDTRTDLANTIILPVRNYFLRGWVDDELREALNLILPPEEINALVKCASRLRARGLSAEQAEQGMNLSAYEDNHNECALLEQKIAALQALYMAVRKAMIARASFVLQTRSRNIEEAFGLILDRGLEDIEEKVRRDLPDEIADQLMAKFFERRAAAGALTLPDRLFELPEPHPETKIVQEFDGTQLVTQKTGNSCFKTKETIIVDIFKDRPIRSVELPGANAMAEQWEAGIKAAEPELWKTLGRWFQETSQAQRILFQEAAKEVQAFLVNLYDQRLHQNQDEFERREAELDALPAIPGASLSLTIKVLQSFARLARRAG